MLRFLGLAVLGVAYYTLARQFDLVALVSTNIPQLAGYEEMLLLGAYTLLIAGMVSGTNHSVTNSTVDLSALNDKDIQAINLKLHALRVAGEGDLATELKKNVEDLRTIFTALGTLSRVEVNTASIEAKITSIKNLECDDLAEKIEAIKGYLDWATSLNKQAGALPVNFNEVFKQIKEFSEAADKLTDEYDLEDVSQWADDIAAVSKKIDQLRD